MRQREDEVSPADVTEDGERQHASHGREKSRTEAKGDRLAHIQGFVEHSRNSN